MWTIVCRIWKVRARALIGYSLGAIAMVLLYASLLPTFVDQADELGQFYDTFPQEFLQAFGVEEFVFDTMEKFLSVEYYSLLWPILVITLCIGMAGTFIAGDIERGTIEHALARPIARSDLFLSRYVAGVSVLSVFVFFSTFSAGPMAWLFAVPYDAFSSWYLFVLAWLFAVAVFSIGMLFSASFSEKSRVSMMMGVLFVAMYVGNIIALLLEELEWVKYVSFFHYFDHKAALTEHSITGESALVFAVTIVITLVVGAWVFERRDVAV